jgi:hypothetical protein
MVRFRYSAQTALQETREICKHIIATDSRLQQCEASDHSLKAVLDVVEEARAKYDNHKQSKARKWLARLCSRISLYGLALDMLAQHHPEYVALAWGTMKFLIQVPCHILRKELCLHHSFRA